MTGRFAKLARKTLLKLPAPVEPIGSELPTPAVDLLHKLVYAREDNASTSAKLLDDRDLAGVVRALEGTPSSAGEYNNLGCAYAGLAVSGTDPELWLQAAEALHESDAVATEALLKERAKTNLALVAAAAGGIVISP